MDIFYHGIVGYSVAKVMGNPDVLHSAVAAMTPDILGIIPFFYFKIQNAPKTSARSFIRTLWKTSNSNTFTNSVDLGTYQFFHSFVALPLVALLSFCLYPASWLILTLAYTSHILIDIPTHEGDFTTQFLYPFSTIHFKGKNWAKHRFEFLLFWGGLIVILFAFHVI